MNRKAVKSTLSKKFLDWMNSIQDEKVKGLVKNNTIITGGCIASMLLGEDINDFDIYFTNKETTKAVANYYVDKFNLKHNKENCQGYKHKAIVLDGSLPIKEQIEKYGENKWETKMLQNIPSDRIKIIVRSDGVAAESGVKEVLENADEISSDGLENIDNNGDKKDKYRPIFLSTNAITLSDKIQIVVRFYGNAEEIHKNFDFIHCTNYWTSNDKKLYTNVEALESILSKNLFYMGSKYPLCSVIRTRKFIKRGWHINAGQYLKMCFQLSELNLVDIETLEEQLIGVDTMYFMSIIEALKDQKNKNPGFEVSQTYVASIVDKIF